MAVKPETPAGFYTVKELATYWQVHENTVRNMILRGEMSAVRIGRNVRIPLAQVEAVAAPFKGGEYGVWNR